MPFFTCKVLNSLGKEEIKVCEASDIPSLRANLKRDKFILVKATKLVEKEPNLFFAVSSKIKPEEVVLFLRQFAVMVNASISISDSLDALKKQSFTAPFKKVLMEISNDVVSGLLLSEAFGKHQDVFPHFFVQMVAIGEVSGSLDKVLTSMADYFENEQKIKKKTKAALAYPTLLLVMVVAVVAFLSGVILPQFEDMFSQFGAGANEIPEITRVIFSISKFINANILYILLGAGFVVLSLLIFFTTKPGAKVLDTVKLKFPFIGKINESTVIARFTKAFIILLQSGMNITDCMANLTKILDNNVYKDKFEFCIEEVKRGKRIARSMENTGLFPSMLTEMIRVGENTGNLEEVLKSTSIFYESQVETAIQKATAAIEPLMIVILGGIVAVVILSIYLPMITLMNQV